MKYIFSIILFFICATSFSQIYQNRPEYGWRFNRIRIDSTLSLPKDTLLRSNFIDAGAIVYNTGDSALYTWNGAYFIKQGRVGAGPLINKALDSLFKSSDSIYVRYNNGSIIGVKLNNIQQSDIVGLIDSIQGNTLQRVTERGDTTNKRISLYSYATDAIRLYQRAADMRLGFYNSSNALFGGIGDLGSSNQMEIAGYTGGISLSSTTLAPVQLRVNNTLVGNWDDTLVTVNTPMIASPPTKDHHVAEKIYVDTTARNAIWRTQMTPLLTQPALPIQPTDTLTQALGKLQAQILNINSSTYIQNQKAANQTADIRISGEVQSASAGSFGGWYTSGIAGPLLQVGVVGGVANVLGFNRTTSAYIATKIDGLTLALNSGSSGNVGIKTASPSFALDVNGGIRATGANWNLFMDRTSVTTQDNIIGFRSPGTTSTDTIAAVGLASRSDNSFYMLGYATNFNIRHRVDSSFKISTYIQGNTNSRKDIIAERNGKMIWGDSLTSAALYPIHVTNTQDTSAQFEHKVIAKGGFIGPQMPPIRTITTSQTLLATDRTLLVNNSGAVTETLPTAASVPGIILTIKKFSAVGNNVSIQPAGAELLDGSNSAKVLTLQYSAITVQSNGTGWIALSYYLAATTL